MTMLSTNLKTLASVLLVVGSIGLGRAAGDAVAVQPKDAAKPDVMPKKSGPEWILDLDQAKKLAKAAGKDLLIVFTGRGWCHPCMLLDQEVFESKDFVGSVSKNFVFVEFDSIRGDSPTEKRRCEQIAKLQQQFLTNGSVPTVILADAEGVPYAIRSGYQSGSGPTTALFALRFAKMAKDQRDRFFKKAATLTGDERAEELHKAISAVGPFLGSIDDRGGDPVLTFYKSQVDDILRSTPADSALRKKYEARIACAKDWHAHEAVFSKLKEFQDPKDYPKALEYIATGLETIKDKSIRWRLEWSRQITLEWSKKYDEALANSRRLQKLPDLSAEDRESLLDRESYNLFNLKRIDEGLAQYDRRIAEAKGDSKKRLRLMRGRADMVVAHEGPIEITIPACLDFREAADPKSENWLYASHLLVGEYQRAAQHQKAINLLEEVLAIERYPAYLLTAAESYIALGMIERAKVYIGDAKKAAALRSERNMERVVAFLERRIAELEKRTSSPKTKQ